jgi:Spy/CpxP family protein refolding chaperone
MERAMGPMGSPQGKFWNNPDIVAKLKLTDEQRKGMDQVLQQHRTTLVDLHANLEKSELALEPMMKEDQPNESQILEQIDKVAAARAELEKANARFLLAIRAKLTPEQWKSLQDARAERREQFHSQGMDRRRGGGSQGAPQGGQQGAPPTPPQD